MAARSPARVVRAPGISPRFEGRALNRRGHSFELAPVARLLETIIEAWNPEQIWLFGSRARGDATPQSDWDLLVVLPDGADGDALDPLAGWRLRKDAGVNADVMSCLARDFLEDRATPNTLAYEAATEGVLLYER